MSTQIEMKLQAAISRIQRELKRKDSESLRHVAVCCAVLHNRVAEVYRIFPDTDSPVVDSEAEIVVVERKQANVSVSKHVFEDGTETGGPSYQ